MSDVTRPTGGAPADHGPNTPAGRPQNAPDARGDSALGTPPSGRAGEGGPSAAAPGTQGEHLHSRLLPHEECDKLASRLQHAVTEFVDGPRGAVEEADHVLEELASRVTDAVTERRRTLRRSWQSAEAGEGRPATTADTEQLRLVLRDYRELAERLLRV